MVKLDISLPETCEDCPCSRYVQSGRYEGLLMCNAIEFREKRKGIICPLHYVLFNHRDGKPGNCPMSEENSYETWIDKDGAIFWQ